MAQKTYYQIVYLRISIEVDTKNKIGDFERIEARHNRLTFIIGAAKASNEAILSSFGCLCVIITYYILQLDMLLDFISLRLECLANIISILAKWSVVYEFISATDMQSQICPLSASFILIRQPGLIEAQFVC